MLCFPRAVLDALTAMMNTAGVIHSTVGRRFIGTPSFHPVGRLPVIPGTASVGLAGALPVAAGVNLADGLFVVFNGQKLPANFDEFGRIAQNRSQTGLAEYAVAGEEYLRTLGIPLIRGRMFGEQDDMNSLHVAVISESLARQRWPDQDPIGQVIEFGNMDGNLKPLTIVGIAGDVRARGLDFSPSPIIYVDYRQRGMNSNSTPTIVIRSTEPAGDIVSAACGIFHELAPDVPVKFSTFADDMSSWLADRRFLLFLVGLFAAVALIVAAVGLYGVVAFFCCTPYPVDRRPYSAWHAAQRRAAFGIRTRSTYGGRRSRNRHWSVTRDHPPHVIAPFRH